MHRGRPPRKRDSTGAVLRGCRMAGRGGRGGRGGRVCTSASGAWPEEVWVGAVGAAAGDK